MKKNLKNIIAKQIFIKNNKILNIKNLKPLEEKIVFHESKFISTYNISDLREKLKKGNKDLYFNIVDFNQYCPTFDDNTPIYIVRVDFYLPKNKN